MARPNILWIVTTQWRAQACGYAGDGNAQTPALDRLAGESLNFAEAVTPHPFGPFARAALLTGIPSPENGVRDYFDPLPPNARTIAHALAERGYATGFFGKWHLAARDRGAALVGEAHARMIVPPEGRGGFGTWLGFESGFQLNDPWLHGTDLPEPVRQRGYQSDVVTALAAKWMERAGAWFCVVSLEPPHPPYDAPAAGIAPPAPDTLTLPPNVPRGSQAEQQARRELSGYYAHIAATDRAIGRMLDAIDRDRTIIVFTSVHGDMHGAHGLFRKGWPHEESVRVPLLVRLPPGQFDAAPSVRRDLVSLLDVPAWTLHWSEPSSGVIAWRASGGRVQRISMPCVVTLPRQCDRTWNGIRTRTRKLVLTTDGAPWLFFDLERDPWEMRNLVSAASCAEEIAVLRDAARPVVRV